MPNGGLIALPRNRVIQLSIPAANIITGSPHPIHLHGHSFSVIRGAGMTGYNFENPVRRDVVSLGDSPNDNVTIRFVTDNAGPWFLHCHIDWHLNA
jgi:iron transport multicopper oxidase